MRRFFYKSGLLIAVLGLSVGAGWVGDGLGDVLLRALRGEFNLSGGMGEQLWAAAAGFVLFVAAARMIYRRRHNLLSSHAISLGATADRPRTILILGLSPLAPPVDSVTAAIAEMDIENFALATKEFKDLPSKPDALNAPIRWQQPFRAVWQLMESNAQRGHPALKAVLVVSSDGHQGSADQADRFIELLRNRLHDAKERGKFSGPEPEVYHRTPNGIDFEDYSQVFKSVNDAVDFAEKELRTNHDQICVDITGGFKIFSVAAAMVTMNRKILFSYVNGEGQSHFYDASIDIGAALGEE